MLLIIIEFVHKRYQTFRVRRRSESMKQTYKIVSLKTYIMTRVEGSQRNQVFNPPSPIWPKIFQQKLFCIILSHRLRLSFPLNLCRHFWMSPKSLNYDKSHSLLTYDLQIKQKVKSANFGYINPNWAVIKIFQEI